VTSALWALPCGLSPVGSLLWALPCGLSAVDSPLWALPCGLSPVDSPLWLSPVGSPLWAPLRNLLSGAGRLKPWIVHTGNVWRYQSNTITHCLLTTMHVDVLSGQWSPFKRMFHSAWSNVCRHSNLITYHLSSSCHVARKASSNIIKRYQTICLKRKIVAVWRTSDNVWSRGLIAKHFPLIWTGGILLFPPPFSPVYFSGTRASGILGGQHFAIDFGGQVGSLIGHTILGVSGF